MTNDELQNDIEFILFKNFFKTSTAAQGVKATDELLDLFYKQRHQAVRECLERLKIKRACIHVLSYCGFCGMCVPDFNTGVDAELKELEEDIPSQDYSKAREDDKCIRCGSPNFPYCPLHDSP